MEISFPKGERRVRTIVLPLIEHEWAFEMRFKEKIATVLHNKGWWFLEIIQHKPEKRWTCTISDDPSVIECPDPLWKGFINERIEHAPAYNSDDGFRSRQARVVLDAIEIICGSVDHLIAILVHATQRNSYFGVNGEVCLDPKKD